MGSSFLMAQTVNCCCPRNSPCLPCVHHPSYFPVPAATILISRTLPLCSILKWPCCLPVFAPQTSLSIHPEVILLSLNSQALSNSSGGKIYFLYMVPISFNKCTAHAQRIHLCHDTCVEVRTVGSWFFPSALVLRQILSWFCRAVNS